MERRPAARHGRAQSGRGMSGGLARWSLAYDAWSRLIVAVVCSVTASIRKSRVATSLLDVAARHRHVH